MDFEFIMFRQDLILISGAMSKYHMKSPIIKLEGNPLVLARGGRVTRFNKAHKNELIKYMLKLLRKKSEILISVLKELQNSMNLRKKSTLLPKYIIHYLIKNGQIPMLVLWNGSNDMNILKKLNITDIIPVTLNMTAYDEHNDNQYYLKLINSSNDELICSHNIGYVVKNGRMLSLSETHSVVCNINHINKNLHDPVTDVLYTKCIFNYLIRLEGYTNIVNKVLVLY